MTCNRSRTFHAFSQCRHGGCGRSLSPIITSTVFPRMTSRQSHHRGPLRQPAICRSILQVSKPRDQQIICSRPLLNTPKPESPKDRSFPQPRPFILPFFPASNGSVISGIRRDDSVQELPTMSRGGTSVSAHPLSCELHRLGRKVLECQINPAADGDSSNHQMLLRRALFEWGQ